LIDEPSVCSQPVRELVDETGVISAAFDGAAVPVKASPTSAAIAGIAKPVDSFFEIAPRGECLPAPLHGVELLKLNAMSKFFLCWNDM
jgi:hypothetical protein